ncbi:beta-galactosidase, partial [Caulobacter sp. UNC279MFTsu5.1]
MGHHSVRLAGVTLALMLAAGVAPVVRPSPAQAQSAVGHPDWPGRGQLFVGA